jgi:very-short-patch-repair endonuclease
MARRYSRSELKLAARTLRNGMTDAERSLWAWLRRKQLYGVQFYRQRPIASYVVDFYAPAARLVIEVDGSQHMDAPNRAYDENRTAALASLGLRVLRFDNRQVLDETQAVLDEISRAVAEAIPP